MKRKVKYTEMSNSKRIKTKQSSINENVIVVLKDSHKAEDKKQLQSNKKEDGEKQKSNKKMQYILV